MSTEIKPPPENVPKGGVNKGKLVRCKACGYIMREDQLGDKCPACGVDRKFFEPYTYNVAENRRAILQLDLHPVAVHFPTSFAATILVCSLVANIFPSVNGVLWTARVLTVILPFVTALAIILGITDGRVRFRSIKRSQILQKKLGFGISLFIIALVMIFIIFQENSPVYAWVTVVLSAIAVGLTVVLGLLGTSIKQSILPGK